MTREHKLALIVGFALILVVGVFVSDHFSKARIARPGDQLATSSGMPRDRQNPPVAFPAPEPVMQLASNPAPSAPPSAPQHEPGTWTTGERPSLGGGLAQNVNDGATRGPGFNSDPRVTPTRDFPAAAGPMVDVPSEGVRVPLPAPHSRETTRTAEAPPAPSSTPALPVSSGELKKHTVARGDSLAKISKKYYGDDKLWKKLAEYNGSRVGADNNVNLGVTLLVPPRDVLMGQAALAPEGTRPQAPSTVTPPAKKTEIAKNDPKAPAAKPGAKSATPPAAPKAADRSYTVKSGDTLALIAERELGSGKRWREIQRLNVGVLGDDDTIAVGMVLKLPAKG